MSFFVYIHTCPNGKKYVGVTKRTPEERWCNGEGYKKHSHFYSAIQKYGWDNIEHEYFKTESAGLMLYWERILIYHYNTMNREFGYNKTSGGEQINGFSLSDDTKEKISKGNKGKNKPPISEETRKKLSVASKKYRHSEETKKKIGEGRRGHKHSEETKKRMSEVAKNRKPVSEETRKKLSETGKGRIPWNKGIKCSDETKQKISEKLKGRVSPMKGRTPWNKGIKSNEALLGK